MAGGSRKEYQLLFKLQAALGGNFNSSFTSATKVINKLQNTTKELNSTQSKLNGFTKQSESLENNKKKLEELQAEYKRLQNEERIMGGVSSDLASRYKKNQQEVWKTGFAIQDQKEKLEELREELKKAGINTDNLTGENEKLKKSYEELQKRQEDIAKLTAAQQKNTEAITKTKAQLTNTIAVTAAFGAAMYAGPVKSAMELESEMSEVAKVVDWIGKTGTQQQIASYKELKNAVLDVTTQIPMTAEEITAIMAAAGQANVATDNASLVAFTKDAAKMGIAFDSTAEQAGEWLAKWRTSFGLTQEQVVELSDKINYLGNTSAANAQQISAIVTKVGPLGEVAGFASGEIAALGSTLVAVGVQEDVAATGIKKVMTTMTAGNAATKRQKEVLDSLGISATELSERMQKDAKGALLDFMKAVNKLPEAEKTAALKNYFGEESVAAIAPMLTKLDLLEEQFRKVGDASLYAGSMESEYAARAETTDNKVQLAKNSISKLSATLGDNFLPTVGNAAEKLTELVTKLADFSAKNPELVTTIAKVVTGLLAFRLAFLGVKLAALDVKSVITDAKLFAKLLPEIIKSTKALIANKAAWIASKVQMIAHGAAMAALKVGQAISTAATTAMTAAQWALNAAFIASPIGWVVLGIGALIAAGVLLYKNWDTVKQKAYQLWENLKQVFGSVTTFFVGVWENVKIIFGTAFEAISTLCFTVWESLKIFFITVWVAIKDTFFTHLENIRSIFTGAFIGMIEAVKGVFGVWVATVQVIFENVKSIFTNLVEFIQNVFTGNWQGAWENVKNIFKNIFGTFSAIAKAPINAVIALINGAIKGINKINVNIPDWVPGIGGKSFGVKIPEIPMFAKGTNNTPDTFIAGEKGAELITNAKGRKVFTAAQTGQIFNNINKGTNNYNSGIGIAALAPVMQSIISAVKTAITPSAMMVPRLQLAYGTSTAAGVSAPTVRAGTIERTTKIEINNQPIIHVDGNKPGDLDEKLRKNNEDLLNKVDEKLRRKEEDERRSRYE